MNLSTVACSFEIKPFNGRIQLFPFGRFFANDNRSEGKGGWYVDDSNGYDLVNQINNAPTQVMIDYEHQTLFIAKNGQGNPAAGWIVKAEYIPNEGIFADVQWTDKARWEVKDKVYRYISPLFIADEDGKVVEFINAALTNTPALSELAEAYALSQQKTATKDNPMLDLLKQLFGLPNATEDEIKTKLTALAAEKGANGVALSDVYGKIKAQDAEVVALSAKVQAGAKDLDPSQYVPLSAMKAVQNELNALKTQINDKEVDQLVTVALSDGRLLPAQKEWATKLGKSNLTALSEYLAGAPKHAGLTENQATATPPAQGAVALSAEQSKVAKMLGLSDAEYLARQQQTQGDK